MNKALIEKYAFELSFALALFLGAGVYAVIANTGDITNVRYDPPTSDSVRIRWDTTSSSTSSVHYGLTPTYGNSATEPCDTGGMTTAHCVVLRSLVPGTTYHYKVESYVGAGNYIWSEGHTFTTPALPDTMPPTQPGTPSYTGLAPTQLTLYWGASADNVRVAGYRIYMNGTFYLSVGEVTSQVIGGLTPGTEYRFKVTAVDGAAPQNESSPSTEIVVMMPSALAAPAIPANFRRDTGYSAGIKLRWDNVSGEDSYKIARKLSTDTVYPTPITVGGTDILEYIDTTALTGMAYDYQLFACAASACSAPVSLVGISLATIAPPASPTNLDLYGTMTSASLPLRWNDNSSNEAGFRLDRRPAGGTETSWVEITWIPGGATSYGYYTDPTVTSGASYDYRVSACITGGSCSGYAYKYALNIPATTAGGPPTAPAITSGNYFAGSGGVPMVSLAWQDLSANETEFRVYRRASGGTGAWDLQTTTGAGATSIQLTGLVSGTYDYRIDSCNQYGCTPGTSLAVVMGGATTQAATTTSATTAPVSTTTTAPLYVTIKVTPEAARCEGERAINPVLFSATPSTGADFKLFQKSLGNIPNEFSPGKRDLLNDVYHWEVVPKSGYTISGASRGDLSFTKLCGTASTGSTSTTIAPQPPAPPQNSAFIELIGEATLRIPAGGEFQDPGARGYLNGISQKPVRSLGGLNTKVPGTYTVMYQLFGPDNSVLASKKRTVVVESVPSSPLLPTLATSSVPALPPPPAAVIETPEEHAKYCDDPRHREECRTFAIQVIAPREITPVLEGVDDELLLRAAKGRELPGSATTIVELRSACATTAFADDCAEFAAETGIIGSEAAKERAESVRNERAQVAEMLMERVGARIFEDRDADGVTDYDEVNIYRTDPSRGDTNGNGVSDSEDILLGLDPSFVSTETSATPKVNGSTTIFRLLGKEGSEKEKGKIFYEDPKVAGDPQPEILRVEDVARADLPPGDESGAFDPSTPTSTQPIVIAGRALPNSIVTLYIFSDPIVVTVRADAAGTWSYTLDRELPDGEHQVYSALTDAGGRILAKSEPLPFVKVAEAITVGAQVSAAAPKETSFFSGTGLYVLAASFIGILLLSFFVIGMVTRRGPGGAVNSDMQSGPPVV